MRQGTTPQAKPPISIPKPLNVTRKRTRDGHNSVLSDMDYTESIIERPELEDDLDSDEEEFN